jgi:two-component system, cell cycle response regulator
MTARILVVDDILANVKLLEARLSAEYFEVLTANNGPDALEICSRERADIVLLDVMMPGMDGFEVCRRLKGNSRTQHIPVIMVTALDQPQDRVQGLEAGADDFLTKPVDDIALVTRVRNFARLKTLADEMRMRAVTGEQLGMLDALQRQGQSNGEGGTILVVDDNPRSGQRLLEALLSNHKARLEGDPVAALQCLSEPNIDLVMISLSLQNSDGLRLCSQIRSVDRLRHKPIVVLVEPGAEARLLRGLDLGVNDYLMRPVDRNEMLARVRTQIRRKRYNDFIRARLEQSVEAAVIDPLTGLHNRRYMEHHLRTLLEESLQRGRALSLLVADIDHFKLVNDAHGHHAGDEVLKEFSQRVKRNIRGIDLACRLGGEEFVVIMPDTELERACIVGERLRISIASDTFKVGQTGPAISVTASVGVASFESPNDTCGTIFERADKALYRAKRTGRNRVMSDAA